jgi:hypothetical protein
MSELQSAASHAAVGAGPFQFTVNEREGSVADPVPLGRQLLTACGFAPADEHVLIRLLTGRTQSVGLDEEVDLTVPGKETFRAFRSDRLFLFTVDGIGFEWGDGSIGEVVLRQIADVPADKVLVSERTDEPDLMLKTGDHISLSARGTERLRTAPRLQLHLTITYNGQSKPLEITRDATVKALLERSIALFGSLPNPHTLALWTAAGVELTQEDQTLKDAHVKDGDCLLLRPSAVKGG